jgi:hypothetical protein
MFAIGFVPDGDDWEAVGGDLDAGLELGGGFLGKTVAGADGEGGDLEHG